MSALRLTIRGIVQGVGFRPFVYGLASELALTGWVRNDASGVSVEVSGEVERLAELQRRLRTEAPPLARIDSIATEELATAGSAVGFRIIENASNVSAHFDAAIGPDACVCPQCLSELFDSSNRRYRYPFINCTDCGPRYSIARHLPYARAATSMSGFVQCPDCLAEYTTPSHRRFHAEPNACPDCGPQLQFLNAQGLALAGDAIAQTLACLQRGEIVAIKGLGGFHLACDARQAAAVARLRSLKQREEKPLAIMVANITSLAPYTNLASAEAELLQSPERPIVLLQKQATCDDLLPGVAPGVASLGVMLPYTPLHYLLFHEAAGQPSGVDWLAEQQELALVMTSANPRGEPLVIANQEALTRLSGIADAYLLHDRDIVTRCDDSVVRLLPGAARTTPQFIRRARGYTPRSLPLARSGANVLALGGVFKNTLCVTRREQAFVSQHIGDLDHVATCLALEETAHHLCSILEVKPQAVAHDLHPDFFSTRLALQLAQTWNVPAIGVQHHHAHIAAVLAEHGVEEPVLGLALDGVGMGTDGTAWGGELLRVDGRHSQRLGHLRPLALPGGDRAAREPWRMAAAALDLLGRNNEITQRFANEAGAGVVAQMLAKQTQAPLTTSLGRWFDAAAGLLGVKPRMSFEGQAAMLLEGMAEAFGAINIAPGLFEITHDAERSLSVLDLAPLLQRISDETHAGRGAALFHGALVEALADWVAHAAQATGLKTVACGGGCFLNAVLARGLRLALRERGLTMLEAHAVPPGDGGLALGQAWVARAVIDFEGV